MTQERKKTLVTTGVILVLLVLLLTLRFEQRCEQFDGGDKDFRCTWGIRL